VAAEELSIHRELAALRGGQVRLEEGLARLTDRVGELRDDIRDLRAEVVGVRNSQLMFATAMVAGLLGVIATLIVQL